MELTRTLKKSSFWWVKVDDDIYLSEPSNPKPSHTSAKILALPNVQEILHANYIHEILQD